jgi:hypothetical protein
LSQKRRPFLGNISAATNADATIEELLNANVRDIGKGEAQQRKYKRLKLGCGQAYDRSSEKAAVVT